MRDEKEERKKQARSNKQTRQSNTNMYMYLSKLSLEIPLHCLQLLLPGVGTLPLALQLLQTSIYIDSYIVCVCVYMHVGYMQCH